MDEGFDDNPWIVKRSRNVKRDFLTDDFNSWGDVEIWTSGTAKQRSLWTVKTTLYDALNKGYEGQRMTAEVAAAVRQIRNN